MIYLKEPNTNRIVEFQSEQEIGAFFQGWPRLNEEESFAYELEQLKKEKIQAAKASRELLLSGSQVLEIGVDGVSCKFSLSNKDLPNLIARQSCLTTNTAASPWNDIDGNRIDLNKSVFQSLIRHINTNDSSVWTLYTNKVDEINSISEENEYFDEEGKEISALEYLQKIKTDLI